MADSDDEVARSRAVSRANWTEKELRQGFPDDQLPRRSPRLNPEPESAETADKKLLTSLQEQRDLQAKVTDLQAQVIKLGAEVPRIFPDGSPMPRNKYERFNTCANIVQHLCENLQIDPEDKNNGHLRHDTLNLIMRKIMALRERIV